MRVIQSDWHFRKIILQVSPWNGAVQVALDTRRLVRRLFIIAWEKTNAGQAKETAGMTDKKEWTWKMLRR